MEHTAKFDYAQMARDAARERDTLHALLEEHKKNLPQTADQEFSWRRENGMLYAMYLEQRCNAQVFARRARSRGGEVDVYAG